MNNDLKHAADLASALRAGESVNLGDLARTRKRISEEARRERAAYRRAEEARKLAARKRDAEMREDLDALRALGYSGVYGRHEGGGLYELGALSDADTHYATGEEIVEVEYEMGGRRWLPRRKVVVV